MFIESMCPRLLNQRNGAVVFALPLLYIIRHGSSCVVCTFSFRLFHFFRRPCKMRLIRSYALSSLGGKKPYFKEICFSVLQFTKSMLKVL